MPASVIDAAFKTMIPKSAEIIAQGRPAAPFKEFKYIPPSEPKASLELALCAISEKNHRELSITMRNGYAPLLAELKRFEPYSIVFSSLEPAQGVSFTAANIARLFAEDETKRTLLVEFYNGPISEEFEQIPDEKCEALSDAQLLEKYITYDNESKLFTYAAHAASGGVGLDEFWKRIKATFDLVLFDCSPGGYNSMLEKVAPLACGTVLIASNEPDAQDVQKFDEDLRLHGGRFIGVVMNAEIDKSDNKKLIPQEAEAEPDDIWG